MVPALVDGKTTLTQSLAILEYLEEKYPNVHILPKKTAGRAFVRQIANIIVSDVHPLLTLRVFNHLSGELGVSQAQKTAWHHKWLKEGFDAVEKLLEQSPLRTGPYCCGNEVTIADICLIPQIYDARRYDMPLDAWPVITEVAKNCLHLQAFREAAPENQPDTPEDHRPAVVKGKS
jgi:maleylacetoacetate isomerase